jgi:phospholipid-binding lipoprotein MlaA
LTQSAPRTAPARRGRLAAALAAAALALAGCATPDGEGFEVADPYEPTNREIHEFNKGWDVVLLRPAARLYQEATPGLFKLLISNGLDMLDMPMIFANQVLQGEPMAALRSAGRVGINLVFGGGLLDPATEFGLPKEETDLGVTFARWGVDEGPYVTLPLLGPGTARDAAGRVIEIAVDPFNFVTGVPAVEALGPGAAALGFVNLRAQSMNSLDQVLYESADSYEALKTTYIQRRRRTIQGGPTEEDLPDVFADE